MWICDIYGNGLDLSTGRTLSLVQKSLGSKDFEVCLFIDIQAKSGVGHSYPIYTGAEADCRAYIAGLVGKLNAPAHMRFDDYACNVLTRLTEALEHFPEEMLNPEIIE